MKKVSLALLAFNVSLLVHLCAVTVQLPDAKTLTKQIHNISRNYFLQKSNLIEDLADQDIDAVTLYETVSKKVLEHLLLTQTDNSYMNTIIGETLVSDLQLLVRDILKNFPEAIQELEGKEYLRKLKTKEKNNEA